MANIADAMRADMERIDACKKVLKQLRDEIIDRVSNKTDQEAVLQKLAAVEGEYSLLLSTFILNPVSYLRDGSNQFAAVVLQTKDATFTPDVKIVCIAIVLFSAGACDVF
jgi:hypothetical protein